MIYYIRKYDKNGNKIEEITEKDMLKAFWMMGAYEKDPEVKQAKMFGQDGRMFSQYDKFES